ncbi:hypothetical protein [Streptomyces sp. LaPpAH-108]|uniref:hypothetical protein n=1 Tax=Streptomyces sp. LaPpAH-108 TaxID=1155714 RepID=UPI00037E7D38|nr:hypothetical protein [Streptomyces sp. LaPpAH-108]
MRPSTDQLKGLAEAFACVTLAGMCVWMAVDGEYIAWAVALGSLSFAWDVWRRFRRSRDEKKTPRTPEGGTSPGNPEGSAALGKDS